MKKAMKCRSAAKNLVTQVCDSLETWQTGRNRICHHHNEYVNYVDTFTMEKFEHAVQEIAENVRCFEDHDGNRYAQEVVNLL